jgi:hypothetical protein
VLESFGQTGLQVLTSIGRQIGKMLIAQGTAMLVSSIFGMGQNAAAGAAYIAAGTTLVGLSAKFAPSTGGNVEEPDTPETPSRGGDGGRVTKEVDAPGRRRGGPVTAGRLYETHGLGQREYFLPERNGAIVTADHMRAMDRSRGGQRVDVRTDSNVNIDVSEPDLFELRAQLNELENEVDQLR